MKLLFCGWCSDIVRLNAKEWRYCECGSCYGRYHDKINASVGGNGVLVLGIDNTSFISAMRKYSHDPNTKHNDFKAFIIPEDSDTVDFD